MPARSGAGAAVVAGPCAGAARGWEFGVTDGAYDFNLYDKATGLCLAISGNSQFAGSHFVQEACGVAPDAIWQLSFG